MADSPPYPNARPYEGSPEDAERDLQACHEAMQRYADAMAYAGMARKEVHDETSYESAKEIYEIAMVLAKEAEIAFRRRYPERGDVPLDRPEPPERP